MNIDFRQAFDPVPHLILAGAGRNEISRQVNTKYMDIECT